jgi:hypothetical protein
MQAAELQASIEGHQATLGALERTAAALEVLQGERDGLAADLAAASEAAAAAQRQLADARGQLQQQAQEAAAQAEGLAKVRLLEGAGSNLCLVCSTLCCGSLLCRRGASLSQQVTSEHDV